MARTNPTDVATIFDTDLDTSNNGPLDIWVDIASDLVDDVAKADSSITSTRLENIEKLLAAHLASSQDQRLASGSSASSSVEFQGDTGIGIMGTKYGQQAASLDPTGTLANMHKPSASITVPEVK